MKWTKLPYWYGSGSSAFSKFNVRCSNVAFILSGPLLIQMIWYFLGQNTNYRPIRFIIWHIIINIWINRIANTFPKAQQQYQQPATQHCLRNCVVLILKDLWVFRKYLIGAFFLWILFPSYFRSHHLAYECFCMEVLFNSRNVTLMYINDDEYAKFDDTMQFYTIGVHNVNSINKPSTLQLNRFCCIAFCASWSICTTIYSTDEKLKF